MNCKNEDCFYNDNDGWGNYECTLKDGKYEQECMENEFKYMCSWKSKCDKCGKPLAGVITLEHKDDYPISIPLCIDHITEVIEKI